MVLTLARHKLRPRSIMLLVHCNWAFAMQLRREPPMVAVSRGKNEEEGEKKKGEKERERERKTCSLPRPGHSGPELLKP
jgi:hypothetical protein